MKKIISLLLVSLMLCGSVLAQNPQKQTVIWTKYQYTSAGSVTTPAAGYGTIFLDGGIVKLKLPDGSVQSFTMGGVGVTSITGTANQITASGSTGDITLSLPTEVHIGTGSGIAAIGTISGLAAFANSNRFTISGYSVLADDGITYLNGQQQLIFRNNNSDVAAVYPNELQMLGSKFVQSYSAITLGAGATSFSVGDKNSIGLTGDAGGNTITSITNGSTGQLIEIIGRDSLVTISNAGTLHLRGNWVSAAGKSLILLWDGSGWYEQGRNGLMFDSIAANKLVGSSSADSLQEIAISSPLALSGGTLSIDQSNGSTSGFLSSTDWNTFNNKESALTFSTGLNRSTNTITVVDNSTIQKINFYNNGSLVGTRKSLNLVAGTNVTFDTFADDVGNDRVNLTISSSGGGSSAWNDITNPTGNQALSMGVNTTTWTWGNATGSNDLFKLTDSVTNGAATGNMFRITTTTGSTLNPMRVIAAGTEALAINSTGNVGIGTATPTLGKLQLLYNNSSPVIYLRQNNQTGSYLSFNNNGSKIAELYSYATVGSSGIAKLEFTNVSNSTTGFLALDTSTRLILDSSGGQLFKYGGTQLLSVESTGTVAQNNSSGNPAILLKQVNTSGPLLQMQYNGFKVIDITSAGVDGSSAYPQLNIYRASGGGNPNGYLRTNNSDHFVINAATTLAFWANGSEVARFNTDKGWFQHTPIASTSGSPTIFSITAPAHTALAASTEATDVNFNLARTVQFSTGALTTQRAFRVQAPTYGFVGASTLTNAITVSIAGAPAAGTNATLTRRTALKVEADETYLNGSVATNVSSVLTANTTLDQTYSTVLLGGSSNYTITLPAAANCLGREYDFYKTTEPSANNTQVVTIDANGSETINSALTLLITSSKSTAKIKSDGSNWIIVNRSVSDSARVYRSTNQTISTATNTAISYDTDRRDYGGIHNTASNTSRLTVQTAGLYDIGANIQFDVNATGSRAALIRLNGSTTIAYVQVQANTTAGNSTMINLSTQYELAATDYVEILVFQNSGGNLDITSTGNFSNEAWINWLKE